MNAFENLGSRLLDMVHRLGQHFDIAVVELDVVGGVLKSFETQCLTDDMRSCCSRAPR